MSYGCKTCMAHLVDKVLQIGTGHARAASSDDRRVNIDVRLDVGHVVFKNCNSASDIG